MPTLCYTDCMKLYDDHAELLAAARRERDRLRAEMIERDGERDGENLLKAALESRRNQAVPGAVKNN